MSGAITSLRSGRFTHTITLVKRDVKTQEIFERFAGNGRSTDAKNLCSIETEIFFYFAED
jgi:hypothetical protein